MFKKTMIGLLTLILVALTANQVSALIYCRTATYCILVPGSIDFQGALITKYAGKYDVAVSLIAYSPVDLPSYGETGYPPPIGWVDYGTVGYNNNLSMCINPDGWTSPGQNPGPIDVQFSGLSILTFIPKNGKTSVYVNGVTEQPANIVDYCPNRNWSVDMVPEYISNAKIQEIILVENADGTKTCYEASSLTFNNCYVNLNDVSWDTETLSFTGPPFECVGAKESNVNNDPFIVPLNGTGQCPAEIQ